MASGVDVDISDIAIISALNTPGGAVFGWRDDTAVAIIGMAIAVSPQNDPLNAKHRGEMPTGGISYKAAWGFDRMGSNQHRVRATIYNGSDHADIVEFGRFPSSGIETFAWTEHRPPGATSTHEHGTSGRDGRHILRDSVNARGAATGDYAPLT